jgi:hypothetical protein
LLEFWCKLASKITKDKFEDDSDDSKRNHAICNGTYSVKMKLDSTLPQFLPVFWNTHQVVLPWHNQEMLKLLLAICMMSLFQLGREPGI